MNQTHYEVTYLRGSLQTSSGLHTLIGPRSGNVQYGALSLRHGVTAVRRLEWVSLPAAVAGGALRALDGTKGKSPLPPS